MIGNTMIPAVYLREELLHNSLDKKNISIHVSYGGTEMAKKLIGTLLSLFTFYLVIDTYLDTGSIFWLFFVVPVAIAILYAAWVDKPQD